MWKEMIGLFLPVDLKSGERTNHISGEASHNLRIAPERYRLNGHESKLRLRNTRSVQAPMQYLRIVRKPKFT